MASATGGRSTISPTATRRRSARFSTTKGPSISSSGLERQPAIPWRSRFALKAAVLQIDNRLITVAASGAGALTLHRLPGSPKLEIAGQIPAGAAPFVRTASVDNPTRFFVTALRHALEAEGIKVNGDAIDIDDFASKPDLSGARLLASHKSPPLRTLVAAMMKVSQNQYAEMLLKSAGGRTRARDVLKSWNIADGGYVIADGSGLSRYNYITSENLVRVLQVMRSEEKHARDFAAARCPWQDAKARW